MKSNQPIIRKHFMEPINNTTLLIGIKDKHISLNEAIQRDTHTKIIATLDYHPPNGNTARENRLSMTSRNLLKFLSSKLVVPLVLSS